MWYLKFRVKHKGCIYSPKTKEYGIVDFTYQLGHVLKGKEVLLSAVHVLQGPPEGLRQYVVYLKKHPAVLQMEGAGNVFFTEVREQMHPVEYRAVYNPALLFPAPVMNGKDGYETWELASWNREPLEKILKLSKSPIIEEFKLLEFKKKVIHDVYLTRLLPKLPPKQLEALRLAFEHGYYAFPKKTDLNELARLMKVRKATFQEHLKRAEAKIIPFILQQKFT